MLAKRSTTSYFFATTAKNASTFTGDRMAVTVAAIMFGSRTSFPKDGQQAATGGIATIRLQSLCERCVGIFLGRQHSSDA